MGNVRRAAVSLIERDGRMLCVWNRRYGGWSLPGGMVERGELVESGQERELREETGLETVKRELVFEGEHGIKSAHKRGRASRVCLFRVVASGEPRQMENGCPIAWKTREEFLAESPFASFYRGVFESVPQEFQ
jgi:ADP-ribose pyrophosphatase YjhB (NUDIX family)